MPIRAGQMAPTFEATTFRGEPIRFEQFRGEKVWLGFYRWASCPLCNLRVKEVIERRSLYESAGSVTSPCSSRRPSTSRSSWDPRIRRSR